MKTQFFTLIAAIAIMFSSFGCKKGEKGDKGDAGADGNANVASVTITPTWTWDASTSTLRANVNPLTILTTDISNKGAVLVYFQISSGDWVPLPRTVFVGGITQSQRFSYTPYWLVLILQNENNSQPSAINLPFKIVCISASARNSHPEVNYENYEEVKKVFNLED